MSPTNETASDDTRMGRPGQPTGIDWDATVREAFFEACVGEGVRAELSIMAFSEDGSADSAPPSADEAARRAALGWLTIETSLEQFGELAALALERCIEEASLQIKRHSSLPPPPLPRKLSVPSQRLRDELTLAIIERGRDRLARFRHGGVLRGDAR